MSKYLTRLKKILVAESVPYGFTLTIWATGTLGIERYKHPGDAGAMAFIGGAIAAYAVFAILLRSHSAQSQQAQEEYRYTSIIDFLSVPAAVGAVIGIYHMVSTPLLGFALASFVAVMVYNLVLAAKRLLF